MPDERVPHHHKSLSDAERAGLRPGIDLDALESLLTLLPADVRQLVLQTFARPMNAEQTFDPSPSAGKTWLPPDLVFADPVLQDLVEQVVAPLWAADTARKDQRDWHRSIGLPARQTPVLLVMPRVWKYQGAVLLVRQPHASPADSILLDQNRSDVPLLDAALSTLVSVRCTSGIAPTHPETIHIDPTQRSSIVPKVWSNHLTNVLGRLRAATQRDTESFGPAKVMEFRIAY